MFRTLLRSPAFLLACMIAVPIGGGLLSIDPPVLLGVLLGIGGASRLLSVHQSRENARLWSERPTCRDSEFLRDCGLGPGDSRAGIALAIRESIAALATVPSGTVWASDPFRGGIDALPFWDSLDAQEFVLALEERLGARVPHRIADLVAEASKTPDFLVHHFVEAALPMLPRVGSGHAAGDMPRS